MSKPSRRPNRETVKQQRKEKKRKQRELWGQQKTQGLVPPARTTSSNGTSQLEDVEQERQVRTDATTEQVQIARQLLPILLRRLSKIKDPRNPKRVVHKLTVCLLYGILSFVYQMASRRAANKAMTRPMFKENLQVLFPELETIPHHDTLYRLLERIDVNEIEATHLEVVRRQIRNKRFCRFVINSCYPIAVDGTQKLSRDVCWSDECLQRRVGKPEDEQYQYYVYVLEANLAFHNGMSIPLMSEFLTYRDGDTQTAKQDCELKAFKRLVERLKTTFPRLRIMLLLDGLYPNGPIIKLCCQKSWDYMIVLQDKSLPSVWAEFRRLRLYTQKTLLKNEKDDCLTRIWRGRVQEFEWLDGIEYAFDDSRPVLKLNLVTCHETWQEVDKKSGETVTKSSRHAWLSRRVLTHKNVHERCNLGARHRWTGIETSILVEKCQGYHYEHCFAYDWTAMKGYHYLMRMAHLFNELAKYSASLAKHIRDEGGVRAFIRFVRETIAGPWLDHEEVRRRLEAPFLSRLVT